MAKTDITPRAWAELCLLGLIWGGSFLAIRTALDEIGALTSVLFRTAPAALLLWGVALVRGLPVPKSGGLWLSLLVMGILNNVLPFSLMAWGQLHIPSGLTAIFNAATAIFGVLVAALVFADERLTARRVTGVTLGFAGVACAIGPSALTGFDLTSLAQLAVLGGTLSYACAGAWARHRLSDLHPVVAAAGMLSGSTVVMLPLTLAFEGAPPTDLTPQTWAAIGYYALVATALAYLLYYRVLAMAGAGNLMLVTLLIPPVAILLGAVVRGEVLHPSAFAGLALLVLGLLILNGRLPMPRRKAV